MQHLKRVLLAVLPLVLLVGLVAVFALNMDRDPSLVRSVLINKPAPSFTLPAVAGTGVEGFDTASLKGEVTVVNVFASWCIPCREEHPLLERLKAETGVRIFGINQKDAPENAVAFLTELGNPYQRIGGDTDNRVSIDWGVYGVPETFVVNAAGVITFKHVGPISPQSLEKELIPAIEKARAG
ncbi:MAG: thiol:disulfide interchange protein [Devosia sp. 66-14]|nr:MULTISPECIES: DsbE family thiol:disulfide interchange protein [unclassified Devosia]MBN9362166.1 DsbE family thiol:disulfide interchange protein [Devosia sp.]ODS81770.1 MAG: thiol:disulfide interchange protein [Devosia sp. SCN 66-27]OJX24573.1 MAG: thiol:disulfide interchange protein [Devosia sp. 66-14]